MNTGSQIKIAAPAAHTAVAKPAPQPSPLLGAVEAPSIAEQLERARLGHSFGAISVLPPDPPIQPKRSVELGSRLDAFRLPSQSRANTAPVIPKGWAVHLPIQAKLTVGASNDPYEQEADRVADQVMRMAEPRVQAKSDNAATDATPDLESRLAGSRGRGQALSNETRSSMESAFGVDFGSVRVHTDGDATQMNHELSAHAFTHGSDIYFNAGKYEPGSQEGKGLLAHELTHVVQQGSDTPQKVSPQTKMGFTCPTQEKGRVQRFPNLGLGTPSNGVAATVRSSTPREPVELKGKAAFAPPADLALDIKNASTAGNYLWVAVKFGELATGELPVMWNGLSFESKTPPPDYTAWPIQIHHSGFKVLPLARPAIGINIDKSLVHGFVCWVTGTKLAQDPTAFFQAHPLSDLFGWDGLKSEPPESPRINMLRGGQLAYEQPARFSAGAIKGGAHVHLYDEDYQFGGGLFLDVKGINDILPLTRNAENKLFAGKKFQFERALGKSGEKLSGTITGTFAGGIPDIRGTLNYRRAEPNVSGSVTVMIASFDVAQKNVRDKLGPDAPADIKLADPDDKLAITGWGHVDFALNKWLNGNADVIVHPEGYITAKGEIVPTKIIPILKLREKEKKSLFSKSIDKVLPGLDAIIADISLKGSLDITGYASYGPGTMHDLRVAGLFSTHPAIGNTFDFSGTLSVPAVAGIKALAKGGIVAQVWFGKKWEAARVGITIQGDLALQLYAEAAAAAGRRKGDDGQPEYFVKGKLHGGSGLKLDLHMLVSGELAFWSKHIELYNRTYNIAGGSATIDFDYTFGGNKKKNQDALKLSVNLADFDQNKFAEAVLRGETVKDKKYKGEEQAPGEINVDPNPKAPIPVELPDPNKPLPIGPSAGVTKTFEKAFKMEGADHELKLTLSDPPGLAMQSPVLEPLLRKIERARKNLEKDTTLAANEKNSRLVALDQIEASANGVQAAAARAAKNPAFITPQIPGFDELARLISEYGDAYDVTDLGVALDKVVVDPTKPETVLKKFPSLASDELVRAQVARIIAYGVKATDLRKIVENVRPIKEDGVLDILGLIDKMIASGATNWDKVITDLRIGGNKFKGASFVIRYIDTKLGWDNVGFELGDDPQDFSGRRWDAWVSGTLYQFKSWYAWPTVANRTFLRQILEDYHLTRVNQEMELRWVFETSLSREEIIRKMKDALSEVVTDLKAGRTPKVDGYSGDIALFIFARLESIVVKA